MQLLVSVSSAEEARAALAGGADIVDAKDPATGALGAVSPMTFRAIVAEVAGTRPVTAALGDARDPSTIASGARTFAEMGASLVKVGFATPTNRQHAKALAAAAVRGARAGAPATGVIVVAYADAPPDCVSASDLLEVASTAGAVGVLLDTADKRGPGLTELVSSSWLAHWVDQARRQSLLVALAGRLRALDLPIARHSGADVAGVRGAACHGGRMGRIDASQVVELRRACHLTVDLVARP